MPRKRALKLEVADGIRKVKLGVPFKQTGTEVQLAESDRNRRIRNRTYGGVRGRERQLSLLLDRPAQSEHEVFGKAIGVPFHRLDQSLDWYAVQLCQIPVLHNLAALYEQNTPFNHLFWDQGLLVFHERRVARNFYINQYKYDLNGIKRMLSLSEI
jgi:hypothetical protein